MGVNGNGAEFIRNHWRQWPNIYGFFSLSLLLRRDSEYEKLPDILIQFSHSETYRWRLVPSPAAVPTVGKARAYGAYPPHWQLEWTCLSEMKVHNWYKATSHELLSRRKRRIQRSQRKTACFKCCSYLSHTSQNLNQAIIYHSFNMINAEFYKTWTCTPHFLMFSAETCAYILIITITTQTQIYWEDLFITTFIFRWKNSK